MTADHQDDDSTQTHTALSNGTEIGHYRIIEKIGAGGMGDVYLAEDTTLNRRVALKFLSLQLIADEEYKARFKREAQAAAVLSHPNIVTIHEVSEYNGRPFSVLEHIEGRSLSDLCKDEKLSVDKVIELAIQICQGLSKAHQAKITHRDIKPSNIVIDADDRPKLLDFGLASIQGSEQITKTGWAMGTVGYMSPEQLRGEQADHRSDIFSVGAVLYEMLTASKPFSRNSEAATLQAVLNETPDPVSRFRTDVPSGLQRVIDMALEKNREKRYQSIDDLLGDLKAISEGSKPIVSGGRGSVSFARPSIAVMPFANLSADPEQEYFCDGMAEEIINSLTHVEGLRVVARTSSFAFKGKNEDTREIGRKLMVETLLEGSVRKAGNRLRITAQLISAADGYHLWSERFDRQSKDIFEIQDEISLAIVDNLKVKLLGEEKAKLAKRPMIDHEVYNLYLKGRYYLSSRTEGGSHKSLDYFLQTLAKDPTNALAHAGIADCYNMFGYWGYLPPREAFPRAKAAAEKALAIDDTLAEAHTSLAHVRHWYDWDWPEARKQYETAIELNPNYATAHQWYAEYFSTLGKHEEGMEEAERSRELDPLSPIVGTQLAGVCYVARKYDLAVEEFTRVLEMDRDFVYAHFLLSWVYVQLSRYDEAIAEVQKAIDLTGGGTTMMVSTLGYFYALSGREAKAREILNEIVRPSEAAFVPADSIALVHTGLGQMDEAFEWLDKAFEQRSHWLVWLKVLPIFDGMRSDDRFNLMLKKMKLIE